MRKIIYLFILCIITSTGLAQAKLKFESTERENGTAFFAMDQNTGQVSFMLDYGSNSGVWKSYGSVIEGNKGILNFAVTERTDGTAFFAMDNTTGKVYYMLDYGSNPGKWKSYGGTIPGEKSNSEYNFSIAERESGTAFFAINGQTGQVYFMLDYGSDSGKWKAYGGKLN